MSTQLLLDLININKVFGDNHVLKNVNLKIHKGKFITFLGPSGCGKTTLLRSIAGFYSIDSGDIIMDGKRINDVPPHKRGTPMVFQEYALFPHLTVFDNVAYGLDIQKRPEQEIQERVKGALAKVKLTGLEARYPHEMSGGQQQRVAMARALVMNSPIMLLDEPLSNLDAKLREEVRVELRTIQRELGLTVIYVTHDQLEALSMSDEIVVFNKGAIDQHGTPHDIYYKPVTQYVADFIGTTNFLSGQVVEVGKEQVTIKYGSENKTVVVQTHLQLRVDELVQLTIRPESVKINAELNLNELQLTAMVRHTSFLGEKERYFVGVENDQEWIVDAYDPGLIQYEGFIRLSVAPEKIHLIK